MLCPRMTRPKLAVLFASSALVLATTVYAQVLDSTYARDPRQAVDQEYTEKIHKYTTDPSFSSPLVGSAAAGCDPALLRCQDVAVRWLAG